LKAAVRVGFWLLAIAITLAFGAPSLAQGSAPPPPDTSGVARVGIPEALAEGPQGKIVLVDVRSPAQRAMGHIQGDVWIPVDQLEARRGSLPRDKRSVFYCSCPAEELALDAVAIVIEGGNTNVGVLVGGYDGWKEAGGPVATEASWEEAFHVQAPPRGWGKTPIDSSRCRYSRDDGIASDGKSSGRILCKPDSVSRGFAGFTQKYDAEKLRGRVVVMEAMVRSANVLRLAFLIIGAEDADAHVLALTRGDKDPIRGTQTWRPAQVRVRVPESAAKLVLGVSLVGAGEIWLDEVRVYAPAENGLPAVTVPVANPGFEG
jgi:rhodanese-related sulfurtransferase